MLYPSLILAALAAVSSVSAAATPTGTDILQYALTLEHLENAFYSGALGKFKPSDFASGGEEYALFQQIAAHEATHVTVLESILGTAATQPCNYSFPYNTVSDFRSLAQIIEGVGVTAYLGAAHFIADPFLLTAAGAILTTEARHAAWLSTRTGAAPWSGAFDTPLSLDSVYSLAAGFITGCPSTNPTLPVKAFPALTLTAGTNGALKSGQNITLSAAPSVTASNGSLYVAIFSGVATTIVPYTLNQTIQIPANVTSSGTLYAVLTSSATGPVTDDNTVAGPTVLLFDAGFPANTTVTSAGGSGTSGSSTAAGSSSSGSSSSSSGAMTSRSFNLFALLGFVAFGIKMVAL